MRNLYLLTLLFLFVIYISCQKKSTKHTKGFLQSTNKTITVENIRSIDTINIEGKTHIITTRNDAVTVKSDMDSLTFERNTGISGYTFRDFNEDGSTDIIIYYLTNIGGSQDIGLYDPFKKKFNKVLDMDQYHEAKKIIGQDLYFSYHRSGCADSNWDSDLFKIEQNRAIKIGNIKGIGCKDTKDQKTGIFIYKIVGKEIILIDKELRKEGYYDDKFEFIDTYWKTNFQLFQ